MSRERACWLRSNRGEFLSPAFRRTHNGRTVADEHHGRSASRSRNRPVNKRMQTRQSREGRTHPLKALTIMHESIRDAPIRQHPRSPSVQQALAPLAPCPPSLSPGHRSKSRPTLRHTDEGHTGFASPGPNQHGMRRTRSWNTHACHCRTTETPRTGCCFASLEPHCRGTLSCR